MPAKKKPSHSQNKILTALPIIIILICAIILRLVFFTGMVRGDDINYSHAAYELSQGRTHFDYWQAGTSRIGLYGPVALLYVVFGTSEPVTLAFPFISSIFTVLIMFGIGSLLDGRRTGLLAALLWACLPLDIFLASDLLPDGPLATFTAAAILFLLLAERNKPPQKVRWIFMSAIFLVWAILIKPTAIITLIFFLIYWAYKLWPRLYSQPFVRRTLVWISRYRQLPIYTGVFLMFFLGITYSQFQNRPLVVSLGRTATDLSRVFLTGETGTDYGVQRPGQIDMFAVLGFLFLISAAALALRGYKPARFALLNGAVYFLYYEWGSVGLNPLTYSPIVNVDERNLLFLLVPFLLLVAIHLSTELSDRQAERIVNVVAGLVSLTVLTFGGRLISGQYSNEFEFIKLIAIIAFLIIPLTLQSLHASNRWLPVGFLSLFVCFALLKPTSPFDPLTWKTRREEISSFRQAADYLKNQDGRVYIASYGEALRLNYASNFNLGFEWAEGGTLGTGNKILVGLPQSLGAGDFYVSSNELMDPAEELQEVYRTTQPGRPLIIYFAPLGNG
jgi:hypothetical protein